MKLGEDIERLLNAQDGRTIEEMVADEQPEEYVVEKAVQRADGTEVHFDGCMVTFLHGPPVEKGDRIGLYCGGISAFGSQRHGWSLNGEIIEWLTPLERAARRLNWLAENDRENREKFAERRAELLADHASLPEPLQRRISRFAREREDFWVDAGAYELFCCTEAAKFAEAARNAADHSEADRFWVSDDLRRKAGGAVWDERPESREAAWLLWAWALSTKAYDYDTKRQKTLLGYDSGHSGNTFGGAMSLAWALLEDRLEPVEADRAKGAGTDG